MATFQSVRKLALSFPGAEEGESYGTPAFRVRKKLFARLREDGDLVVKVDFDERELLLEGDPETFYLTDHYRNYPWIIVRLAKARAATLRPLLEQAWRAGASKRQIAEFDAS